MSVSVQSSACVSAPASLSILSCLPAVCPHVEFAVAAVLAAPVSLQWVAQPHHPGQLQARAEFRGPLGTAGLLASRLRGLDPLIFEVVEGPTPAGQRYSYVPVLGMFRADTGPNGDIVVGEQRLRELVARVGAGAGLVDGLARLLGEPWDRELEPLRQAGEGGVVTYLRRTG